MIRHVSTGLLFAAAFSCWALVDRLGPLPLEEMARECLARATTEVLTLRRVGLDRPYNVTMLADLRAMDSDQLLHAIGEDVLQLYVTIVRLAAAMAMASGTAFVRVADAVRAMWLAHWGERMSTEQMWAEMAEQLSVVGLE